MIAARPSVNRCSPTRVLKHGQQRQPCGKGMPLRQPPRLGAQRLFEHAVQPCWGELKVRRVAAVSSAPLPALRDPHRILLRYDTPFLNELLLANILAPVGGGPLSQNVSDQEYSKLFERDRLGGSVNATYLSTGEERVLGSQFGQLGNFSYAVDVDYLSDRGIRPNNHQDRTEIYSQGKYQLGLQDSLFVQTKFEDNRFGDVFQYYDQQSAGLTSAFHVTEEPLLFIGYHHEWAPGLHTLVLGTRLEAHQTESLNGANFGLLKFPSADPTHPFQFDALSSRFRYDSAFAIYGGE